MKSKMYGMNNDYQKMYNIIKNWDEDAPPSQIVDGKLFNEEGHYFYHMEWSIGDAPYHGWEGESLASEKSILKKVETKYKEFKAALEEALGLDE